MQLLLLSVGIFSVVSAAYQNSPRVLYEWKYFDYAWKSPGHKAAAIASGNYNHTKSVIIDVDRSRDGRIFVTIIRDEGVPSSLNIVSQKKGPGGPLLQPFPNWEWTKRNDCNGITSVYRVAIDHCDRLWVLDTGKFGEKHVCPAQLLTFDLKTNRLIKRVRIPNKIARNSHTNDGLLVTPIVETYGPYCQNTTVYMADTVGCGLVIYHNNRLWRLESNVFRSDPAGSNYTINGESFQLEDGILGMAKHPNAAVLYFRAMSSYNLSSASTIDLKNSQFGGKVHYGSMRNILPSQAAAMAVSSDGTLFFGLPTQLSLGCWNTYKPLNKDNLDIAAYDRNKFQFMSGVKIIPSYITNAHEEIWMVTNRFQKIMSGSMNFAEVNFRIMKADATQITIGTACQPPWLFDYMDEYESKTKL